MDTAEAAALTGTLTGLGGRFSSGTLPRTLGVLPPPEACASLGFGAIFLRFHAPEVRLLWIERMIADPCSCSLTRLSC